VEHLHIPDFRSVHWRSFDILVFRLFVCIFVRMHASLIFDHTMHWLFLTLISPQQRLFVQLNCRSNCSCYAHRRRFFLLFHFISLYEPVLWQSTCARLIFFHSRDHFDRHCHPRLLRCWLPFCLKAVRVCSMSMRGNHLVESGNTVFLLFGCDLFCQYWFQKWFIYQISNILEPMTLGMLSCFMAAVIRQMQKYFVQFCLKYPFYCIFCVIKL